MNVPRWRPAYIGVGGNLGSPVTQVRQGIADLADLPESLLVLQSGLYRSAPMGGPAGQPDYINAVAALVTQLDPHDLLSGLKSIEHKHGRDRSGQRRGPRTLDLDLLACGGLTVADDDLTLPHPGIAERNFVLLPWMEIAPHYRVPGLSAVSILAAAVPGDKPQIERID